MDDVSSTVSEVSIELPRSGAAFTVDCARQLICSRDHRGMVVCRRQDAGTLYGLQHALLLCSDESAAEYRSTLPPKQLLLVPRGAIALGDGLEQQHITVMLPTNPSAAVRVVSLRVNSILRRLEASSFSDWLYLSLLHAATSHVHADPFTGLTGTEQALALLQSPRCLSTRPLSVDDPLQLLRGDHSVLMQIASLSPLCEFYPAHFKCMQTISSMMQLPSQACSPALYFAAQHIHGESRRILFAEPSKSVASLPNFEVKGMKPQLLSDVYFKSKYSYSTDAHLLPSLEQSLPSSAVQPFQAASGPTDRLVLARQLLLQRTPVPIANPAMAADLLCSGPSLTVGPSEADCFNTDFADQDQFRSAWPNLLRVAVASQQDAESALRFRMLLASLACFTREPIEATHLWLLLNVLLSDALVPASLSGLTTHTQHDRLSETFASDKLLQCVAPHAMSDDGAERILEPQSPSESYHVFSMRCRQIKNAEVNSVEDLVLAAARAHFDSLSEASIDFSSVPNRFVDLSALRSDVDVHLRVWRFNRQLRRELTELCERTSGPNQPAARQARMHLPNALVCLCTVAASLGR